jgi:rod shape-determining protein MreC
MNAIFHHGPSLNNRLVIALVCSLGLIFVDHKLDGFSSVRVYMNSLVSPLQYAAKLPADFLSWTADRLTSHATLREQNSELVRKNNLQNERLQRFELLKQENDRLRTLLGSPVHTAATKKIAELVSVDKNPYSHQILLNKGTADQAYVGQAVLDSQGIVGQVTEVSGNFSRVLLITDLTHGIPVRIARNNIRLVVQGSGRLNELNVDHVTHSTDIREGDLLVSSGLGKVFPEGYPVATVDSVVKNEGRPFAQVFAKPQAELDRLKYMLLLWPNNVGNAP